MKARTDALEAQYTQEKHMLLLKAENERQSAVLAVKAEYAARIESCRRSTWPSIWPRWRLLMAYLEQAVERFSLCKGKRKKRKMQP